MKRTIAKVPCEEILDDSLREKLYAEFKLNTDLVKKAEFTKKYDDCFIRKTNFMKVQKAFEKAGIEFLGSPEEGAGVRWKPKSKKEAW